jgi:hypothetical protein
MKWHNRIAQAFRPGSLVVTSALKGWPKCVCFASTRIVVDDHQIPRYTRPIRSPFQGEFLGGAPPGLKTWAVLSGHFMAAVALEARGIFKLQPGLKL